MCSLKRVSTGLLGLCGSLIGSGCSTCTHRENGRRTRQLARRFGSGSPLGGGPCLFALRAFGSRAVILGAIDHLGLEAGGNRLRGFLEIGTGEQGIFDIGLRYKF